MDRVVDKVILLACGLGCCALVSWTPGVVVAMLLAVICSGVAEVLPRRWSRVPGLGYAAASLVVPILCPFLPLVAYDLAIPLRSWTAVAGAALCAVSVVLHARVEPVSAVGVALGIVVAFLLAYRAARSARAERRLRGVKDDAREASLLLAAKNRDLLERRDLEVRLATLAERGRIAREIHDNVGHLLTRSIMQVEALQVVHRNDEVRAELEAVGATLHAAMDEVRESVHDLHDESVDLQAQLREAAAVLPEGALSLDYHAEGVPIDVSACLLAVAREAFSNVVRHSDADRVRVAVAESPGFWRLTVADNGSRPARSSGTDARGLGLAAMEERARAFGGTFHAGWDGGFKVFVSVPKGGRP